MWDITTRRPRAPGGVWFSLIDDMPPLVLREAFPNDISSEVILEDNPRGCLTNSDLDLAAEVVAVGVALTGTPKMKHAPLGTLCDNTPTASWIDRMASKSKSPTAGRLQWGLAFMLYCCHAGWLTTVNVPRVENVMADIASRPSKVQTLFCASSLLSNTNILSSFDTAFPLPNAQVWTLTMVPQWLKSNVFETLRGERLELQQWTGLSANATGERGRRTAASFPKPATSRQALSRTNSSRLLLPCARAVWSWSSGQGSVSRKGSQARCPKACFGWTSQPPTCLPGPAIA
jgi:hypothetical protein